MAGSGVAVKDEVAEIAKVMNTKKNIQYVVFKLTNDLTAVEVEKVAQKGPKEDGEVCCYQDFVNDMLAAEDQQECRYALYDFQFKTNSGMDKEKLVFVSWSPDSAKVKQKMVYASTKDAVKKKIGTIAGVQLQATDKDELEQSCMEEAAKKFDRA